METLPFAEIIEEVYSTRVNHHALRQLAIEMTPAFTLALMNSNPDFTDDLFQATLQTVVGTCPKR